MVDNVAPLRVDNVAPLRGVSTEVDPVSREGEEAVGDSTSIDSGVDIPSESCTHKDHPFKTLHLIYGIPFLLI